MISNLKKLLFLTAFSSLFLPANVFSMGNLTAPATVNSFVGNAKVITPGGKTYNASSKDDLKDLGNGAKLILFPGTSINISLPDGYKNTFTGPGTLHFFVGQGKNIFGQQCDKLFVSYHGGDVSDPANQSSNPNFQGTSPIQ